jgi:hypothetical protein
MDRASVIIGVEPKGAEPWLLKLRGAYDDLASHAEGIYACPSPTHFLVVVDCLGFYIDSVNPKNAQGIAQFPIRKVERYLIVDLLLVVGHLRITAIGKTGMLWTSPQLVRDGLEIIQVTEEYIAGAGDLRSDDLETADFFKISTIDGSILSGNPWCESDPN